MSDILFTKSEIESKIYDLEEEIKDLQEDASDNIAHSKIQRRQEKIRQLQKQQTLIEGENETLNLQDATFYSNFEHRLIFLQARFKSGFFLGFWSHSPWGRTYDQEQGWAVINPETLEIVDYCETKSMGMSSGEFHEWRKKMTIQYGKSNLLRNFSGDVEWKISDL